MRGYNVIVVYNENADKILMCKRKKDPYKGLANFVGGKIEKNENGLDAAYRELEEETTITKDEVAHPPPLAVGAWARVAPLTGLNILLL